MTDQEHLGTMRKFVETEQRCNGSTGHTSSLTLPDFDIRRCTCRRWRTPAPKFNKRPTCPISDVPLFGINSYLVLGVICPHLLADVRLTEALGTLTVYSLDAAEPRTISCPKFKCRAKRPQPLQGRNSIAFNKLRSMLVAAIGKAEWLSVIWNWFE